MEHLSEKHLMNHVPPILAALQTVYSDYMYKMLDTPSVFDVIRSAARDEQMDNIETLIDKHLIIKTG